MSGDRAREHWSSISEGEVARIALERRAIERQSGWQRTLRIGELVLNTFFQGSTETWQSRRRNRDTSIRRLAERPECPLAKSALTEAVAIFVLSREHPWLCESARLTPTHAAAVLGLEPATQVRLLRIAEKEGLSVRSLKQRATQIRRESRGKRGRPHAPFTHKALTCAERALRSLRDAERLLCDADAIDVMTRGAIDSALQGIDAGSEAISRALLGLADRAPGHSKSQPCLARPIGPDARRARLSA